MTGRDGVDDHGSEDPTLSVPENSRGRVDAAHGYSRRGWAVVRLHHVTPEGRCTCRLGADCKSPGKHPRNRQWEQAGQLSGPDIEELWADEPADNVGVATGKASGFWVLDVDPDKDGANSMRALVDAHDGVWTPTYTVQTGSGGWHFYFQLPPDFEVTNRRGELAAYPGLDVRGNGGYVVAPPSVSGRGPYIVIDESPIAPAPPWLLEMIRPKATGAPAPEAVPDRSHIPPGEQQRLDRYVESIRASEIHRLRELHPQPQGRDAQGYAGQPWDTTVYAVSCQLIQLANSPWNVYTLADAWRDVWDNAPRDPGFPDQRVRAKLDSAAKMVAGKARDIPPPPQRVDTDILFSGPDVRLDPGLAGGASGPAPTGRNDQGLRSLDDIGLARRVVDWYGQQLRWVEQAGSWYVYVDGRWRADDERLAHGMIQSMIEALPDVEGPRHSDVPQVDDDGKRKPSPREAFVAWALKQRISARIKACMTEAAARPELRATMDSFDSGPVVMPSTGTVVDRDLLLNVRNGVVDLATGALHEHSPELLMRMQAPVDFIPEAPAPRWLSFLERMQPDPEMRAFLARVVGYSLTALMSEQAMFIHHGVGANGKSVFLEVMSALLGDYGMVMDRETLLAKAGSSVHPAGVARTVGRRLLQTSETSAGRRLDDELVKSMTGGERITARELYKSFFDFKPSGKIHYVTNHLPNLPDAESLWRRLHLIGWRVKIEENDPTRDKLLGRRIAAEELPGVLWWAIQGCLDWQKQGLNPPEVARIALSEYRRDQDIFGDFLEECCEATADPNHLEPVKHLFAAYQGWAFRCGMERKMRLPDFRRTLEERGFREGRTAAFRGHRGIRVKMEFAAPVGPAILGGGVMAQ